MTQRYIELKKQLEIFRLKNQILKIYKPEISEENSEQDKQLVSCQTHGSIVSITFSNGEPATQVEMPSPQLQSSSNSSDNDFLDLHLVFTPDQLSLILNT